MEQIGQLETDTFSGLIEHFALHPGDAIIRLPLLASEFIDGDEREQTDRSTIDSTFIAEPKAMTKWSPSLHQASRSLSAE